MIQYQTIPKDISKNTKNSPEEHVNELEVKCRLSSKQVKDQQLFYWKQFKCPFVIACGEVDPLCSECVQPPIGRGTE